MYRRGVVSKVDVDKHVVRCTLPEKGNVETAWLDVLVPDTLDDKVFSLPSEGAQVALMLDERDEQGCVLGSVYSKVDAPTGTKNVNLRRIDFKDGAKVEYDREHHKLTIDIPSSGELNVTINGKAKIETTGDVEVKPGGLLKIAGAADFVALAAKVDAIVTYLVMWLLTHTHGTGVGPSTPPLAPVESQDSVACVKTKTS